PVRLVLRAFHFGVIFLLAQLLQLLPRHPKVIFGLRHASARRFPLLLQFLLPRFQPQLFCAQTFELLRQFFALLRERRGLFTNGHDLLLQRHLAAFHVRALFAKPRRQSFCRRQSLVNRRQPGSRRG